MKNQRLLIVGAGSFAREMVSWLRSDEALHTDLDLGGFLSDSFDSLAGYADYPPIVSDIASYQPAPGDVLLMAIAEPKGKLDIARKLQERGGKFLTFVHSSVLLADHVHIGQGVVLCPNVVVSCHAHLGDFVAVNLGSTVGHDAKVGAGCTLSAHCDITGFVELAEGVFLGSHASVLPHGKVGAFAKVGAGTVVLRSVKAGATVMGVPAKQILP